MWILHSSCNHLQHPLWKCTYHRVCHILVDAPPGEKRQVMEFSWMINNAGATSCRLVGIAELTGHHAKKEKRNLNKKANEWLREKEMEKNRRNGNDKLTIKFIWKERAQRKVYIGEWTIDKTTCANARNVVKQLTRLTCNWQCAMKIE